MQWTKKTFLEAMQGLFNLVSFTDVVDIQTLLSVQKKACFVVEIYFFPHPPNTI